MDDGADKDAPRRARVADDPGSAWPGAGGAGLPGRQADEQEQVDQHRPEVRALFVRQPTRTDPEPDQQAEANVGNRVHPPITRAFDATSLDLGEGVVGVAGGVTAGGFGHVLSPVAVA